MDSLVSIGVRMAIFEYFSHLIQAANFYSTHKSEYDDYNEYAYYSSEHFCRALREIMPWWAVVNQFVQAIAWVYGASLCEILVAGVSETDSRPD